MAYRHDEAQAGAHPSNMFRDHSTTLPPTAATACGKHQLRRVSHRIYHFLDYWAREQPDAEFAVQESQRLTYAEADTTVNRLAHGMVSSGVQVGERVGILASNRPQHVLIMLAAAKAGVVAVPMDAHQTPSQWLYVLNDGHVKLLFCAGELVHAVDELRQSLDTVEHFVTLDDADGASGWEAFADWLVERPTTPIERPVADTDTLYQIYTSGTTGQPKGAFFDDVGLPS